MLADLDQFVAAIQSAAGPGVYFCPDDAAGADAIYCIAAIPSNRADAHAQVAAASTPPQVSTVAGGTLPNSVPAGPIITTTSAASSGAGGSDAFKIIVTDWVDSVYVGAIDFELMSSASAGSGSSAVPWLTQVRLLLRAIQSGSSRVARSDAAAHRNFAAERALVVTAKGSVPLTWRIPLVAVTSVDARRSVVAGLASRVVRLLAITSDGLARERELRQAAEDEAARIRTAAAAAAIGLGGNGGGVVGGVGLLKADGSSLGVPSGRGKAAAAATAPEARVKPMNLLNPAQRVGAKRPRGQIKIGQHRDEDDTAERQ